MQAFQYENSSIQRQREEAENKEIFRDSVWNDGIKHSIHGNKGMKIIWLERDIRIF